MLDRRMLLKRAGLASAGLLLGGGGAALRGLELPAGKDLPRALAATLGQDTDLPGMPSFLTSNDRFYTVSKNTFGDPNLDGNRWRLRIAGAVANPLELDLAAIRSLPSVQQTQTLECIDNQVGGNLISNAEWTGVRLADVLAQAGLNAGVQRIVFQCEDDYSDSIPLAKALESTTLLAYEMNGQTLPPAHGFPVRVLSPDLYGIKNPKWVTEIRAVTEDYRGYWQRRGWTNNGTIKTMSRIDVPGGTAPNQAQRMGGIAFAGARGIAGVEVSVDDARTWNAANVVAAPAQLAWVLWTADWLPQMREQTLVVRATDGNGTVQTTEVRPPLPDGASGLHRLPVRIGG